MKIGILTFHRAENFGAALQCYALQTFLINEGHNVSIVDYRCKAIERQYQILNPSILFSRLNVLYTLDKYIKRLKHYRRRVIKKRKYNDFRVEYLKLTEKYDSLKSGLSDFDCIIAGSDQIWRFGLTGNDYTYWLDFPVGEKTRKISYAASSEPSDFKCITQNKTKVKELLSGFYAISVREEALKKELFSLCQLPITVVADPTFLLRKESYLNIMRKPDRRGYVFVYYLFDTQEASAVATKIARKNGEDVVEMFAGMSNTVEDANHKSTLGPLEILGYIYNASCVITTSFHGLALSVIMEKEFWVIEKGANQRLVNLLQKLDLQDRIIQNADQIKDSRIDYSRVNVKKDEIIQESISFLTNCLQ